MAEVILFANHLLSGVILQVYPLKKNERKDTKYDAVILKGDTCSKAHHWGWYPGIYVKCRRCTSTTFTELLSWKASNAENHSHPGSFSCFGPAGGFSERNNTFSNAHPRDFTKTWTSVIPGDVFLLANVHENLPRAKCHTPKCHTHPGPRKIGRAHV